MKTFLTLTGTAAIIVALSIGYYFVVYIPQRDQAKLAAEKQIQSDKDSQTEQQQLYQTQQQAKQKAALRECLLQADIDGNNFWNSSCESFGVDKKTDGCLLPSSNADRVDKTIADAKDLCIKEYPQ